MKQLILTILAILFCSLVGVGQNELTVHDGTVTNDHIPMYVFYFDDWTRSQVIIPSTDLTDMVGSEINSITFYTTDYNIPYTTVTTFEIYLKEVDYTNIPSYEDETTMTCIYASNTGNFVTEGTGGKIVFENINFSYNGGNLLIACKNTSDSGWKLINFYGENVNGSSISGSNGTAGAEISANQQNFIPKITFEYTPDQSVCQKPNNPLVSNITSNSATISWSGNATSYNIRTNCKRYNFDTGFQGWTTIDADGDGHDWIRSSILMAGYLIPSHQGNDMLSSQSYDRTDGALNPDNYLVSPLIQFGDGAKITFWISAQDEDYSEEHFGVAISMSENTSPNDFTTIAEWTYPQNMSDYLEYTVDLSSYSGQGYVAIRHFGCTDMFYLNIDDITICEKGSILIENVSSPYIFTNLQPDTEYTYLIESDCGNGNLSALTSINFTTNSLPQPREQCQVGDNWGDETFGYLPSYSLYNYSLTQQIYTAEEIGNSGIIGRISFYNTTNVSPNYIRYLNIYLVHTNKDEFVNNTDWISATNNDLVFSGEVTMNLNDWTEIILDNTFDYNGIDNLALIINDTYGEWHSTMNYKVYTSSKNQSLYVYQDGSAYSVINPTYTGHLSNKKNQIKLCTEEGWTLPINLLEFYAIPDHLAPTPTNKIYIKTGGEWNNCEYIIYRSQDAMNWDYDNPVIDWDFSDNPHDASANVNYSEHSYMEYFPIDHNPYDTTYYKLIQRDCDNTAHEYTSEIIVCINGKQKKSAWDYFAYTHEGLMVSSSDKPITIACYNILGQTVYQTDIPSDDNIVLTLKPPYICVIYCDGEIAATERVLK